VSNWPADDGFTGSIRGLRLYDRALATAELYSRLGRDEGHFCAVGVGVIYGYGYGWCKGLWVRVCLGLLGFGVGRVGVARLLCQT